MIETKYEVWFEDGTGIVTHAFGKHVAIAKAITSQYERNLSTKVESITDITNKKLYSVDLKIKQL